jgi:hypothetical protein
LRVVKVSHETDGTRWADANITSGEEGDWFAAQGILVGVSKFSIYKSTLSTAADKELPRLSLRDAHHLEWCALNSPKNNESLFGRLNKKSRLGLIWQMPMQEACKYQKCPTCFHQQQH